jgi:CRP-like cAMP-binding protein
VGAKAELGRVAIWADALSEPEAERALRGLSERRYEAGAYVFHRGDRHDYWTAVVTGLVKLGAISIHGKEISFAGVGAGGWFGEGSILKNEPRKYDCVALRETRLALLNKASFDWLCQHSVGFNRFLVRQLNERMGQFIAMIEHDRIHDPAARVARNIAWLLNPVLYPNTEARIAITQEEVGMLAGVSRQIANRSLLRLADAGLIVLERGGLRVLDVEALARYEG